MRTLGIDIGGTAIKALLLESGGGDAAGAPNDGESQVWQGRSASYSRPGRDELVRALAGLVREARTRGSQSGERVREIVGEIVGGIGREIGGVGLCVPGVLAPDRRSVAVSINVPGLVELEFRELLRLAGIDATTPVRVVTDALAAATDVSRSMGLRGRVLAISIGTGVGACVLDDGVPLIVSGQGPGHVGQMDVSPWEGEGGVGRSGTLEAYIGVAGLRARCGDDIEGALRRLTVRDEPCRALVRGLRIMHAIYRPAHVVLLGGVGIRLAHLRAELHEAVACGLTPLARAGWTLHFGESDFHAARGAARLAAEGRDTASR